MDGDVVSRGVFIFCPETFHPPIAVAALLELRRIESGAGFSTPRVYLQSRSCIMRHQATVSASIRVCGHIMQPVGFYMNVHFGEIGTAHEEDTLIHH